MWAPESFAGSSSMLATTGDYLRLWHVRDVEGSGEGKDAKPAGVDVTLENMFNPVLSLLCCHYHHCNRAPCSGSRNNIQISRCYRSVGVSRWIANNLMIQHAR